MRPALLDDQDIQRLCCGNQQAIDFLVLWREYVHGIDDIVDGDLKNGDGIIRVFSQAAVLYSSPFYRQHCDRLQLIVLLITNAYSDSVRFEKRTEEWMRNCADVLRHAGAEMTRAVMLICGGYDHLRLHSAHLHSICRNEHTDASGKPI